MKFFVTFPKTKIQEQKLLDVLNSVVVCSNIKYLLVHAANYSINLIFVLFFLFFLLY